MQLFCLPENSHISFFLLHLSFCMPNIMFDDFVSVHTPQWGHSKTQKVPKAVVSLNPGQNPTTGQNTYNTTDKFPQDKLMQYERWTKSHRTNSCSMKGGQNPTGQTHAVWKVDKIQQYENWRKPHHTILYQFVYIISLYIIVDTLPQLFYTALSASVYVVSIWCLLFVLLYSCE